MLLTRIAGTVPNPSGLLKLKPTPTITFDSTFLASGLTAGVLASWPNAEGTSTLGVLAGSPDVVLDAGVPVVVTDGVGDRMSTTTGPAWRSAVMVVKLPVTSTGEDILFGLNTASNGQVVWDSAGGQVRFRNGTAATVAVAASPGWNVITATLAPTGGNATISANKVHASGVIAPEAPPAGLRVAGHFSSGQYAALSISEIRLKTSVLTAAEINGFVDYVKAAYPAHSPA